MERICLDYMRYTYSLEIEASDYAKIISTASKSEVEIWMGLFIDIEDTAACEDDL